MTPRREKRFREVISKRQSTLTVVLENVYDPHNISAVLRSCDAVGVQTVYILNTIAPNQKKLGKKSSASASKWLDVRYFKDAAACFRELRDNYSKIYATHLAKSSKTLYNLDLTEAIALVFGNEHLGVSDEILAYVDDIFIIPQVGMISSLNISVACAVTLYESFRQRQAIGMYEQPQLREEQRESLFEKWRRRSDNLGEE